MSITTILIIGGVVLVAIFVLVARLAVRLAVRLIIMAVILVALVGGAGLLWWANQLTSEPPVNKPPTRRGK